MQVAIWVLVASSAIGDLGASWVQLALGAISTSCFGCMLVKVTLGPSCFGCKLLWVQVALGACW